MNTAKKSPKWNLEQAESTLCGLVSRELDNRTDLCDNVPYDGVGMVF